MKKLFLSSLLTLTFLSAFASEQNKDVLSLQHKIITGFNFGAATPLPIPNRFSNLSWTPKFAPVIGWQMTLMDNNKWGIGMGLCLEYKGMNVEASVYQLYTEVSIEGLETKGYFTGRNETDIMVGYLTLPIVLCYQPSAIWNFEMGIYGSFKNVGNFSGAVKDGYMRVGDPTGNRTDIVYETFSFNDEIRDFDFGFRVGFDRKVSEQLYLGITLNWGISSLLNTNFTGLEYPLYNLYGMFSLGYRI